MKPIDYFIITSIILLVLSGAFFFYSLNKEGKQCIAKPILYYETLYNVSCFCSNDLSLPSNWGEIGT